MVPNVSFVSYKDPVCPAKAPKQHLALYLPYQQGLGNRERESKCKAFRLSSRTALRQLFLLHMLLFPVRIKFSHPTYNAIVSDAISGEKRLKLKCMQKCIL